MTTPPPVADGRAGRAVAAALACVALLTGCAHPDGPRPAASSPTSAGARVTASPAAALDGCLPPATPTVTTSAAADAVSVALLGRAGPVVVLSNQSDENLCSWLPFAATLTSAGYRVALWDYAGASAPRELSTVVAALRARGAARIVLMGASKGAKVSLVAATTIAPPVSGVVALSAESTLAPATSIPAAVGRLHAPVLLVTAAQDAYGAATAGPQILRALPGADRRLVTVPGTAHGVDLLTDGPAATVVPAVTSFLHRVSWAR